MTIKRLIKVTLVITLLTFAYFQLLPNIYHLESAPNDLPVSENFTLRETADNAMKFLDNYLPDQNLNQTPVYSESMTGKSRFTIFGRVLDKDNLAISERLDL